MKKRILSVLALLAVASLGLAQTYDANGRQKVNVETGTTVVTQGTGTNLHAVVDSGTVTVSDGAGALNVIVDSATLGTVTVSDGAGALNTIVDSGTLIATQATGTNLHTVVDSGSVTVSDGAGALNVIVDSATLGTVTVSDGAGAMNVIVDSIAAGDNNIGNVDIVTLPNVTIGTFPDNEPFNLNQIAGASAAVGNGTAATTLRVTVASDSTGTLAGVTTVGTVTNLTNLPNEGQ